MAINRRWNLEHLKDSVIDGLAVDLLSEKPRVREGARKCVIAMEKQNQQDEHSKANEILGRVLGTLAELGVDLASLGITEEEARGTSQNPKLGSADEIY